MEILIAALVAVAVAVVGTATVRVVLRDGYRRRPTRAEYDTRMPVL